MIDYKVIGSRIKIARNKKGMTQEKLSELLNISNEYCSKLERGKTKINLERLSQIAIILEIQIEYLIAGTIVESDSYLRDDISNALKNCSSDKIEAISKVIKIIANI